MFTKNFEGAFTGLEYALISFYALKPEDLPVARKVGDLIRVHKAQIREHKDIKGGRKQFVAHVEQNASWCLFHSCDVLIKERQFLYRRSKTISEDDIIYDEDGKNMEN